MIPSACINLTILFDGFEQLTEVFQNEIRIIDVKIGEIDDFDAMLLAELLFEFIPALYFLQRLFSSPNYVWHEMLRSLAFYSDAVVWNEEVQVHVANIRQPIKCPLFFDLDSIVPQERADLFFEVG